MKIFTLNENTQGYDYEHYNHWVKSHVVNYYATEDLAKDAMFMLYKDLKPEHDMPLDIKLGDIRNVVLLTGYNGNSKKSAINKYFIDSIEVIDK